MDPLVDATGQPYAYTGDDPTDETDPTGLYGRIGRIASASAYGYFVAFNHVTTGNKQAVKPGMVRIQFQFTAQAAAPSTAYILAAIRDETRGESTFDATYDVQGQRTAHPSVLAYPGDNIAAAGVAMQFDGTQTVVLGTGIAPNVKFKIRGTRPSAGLADYQSSAACQSMENIESQLNGLLDEAETGQSSTLV